MELGQVVVTVVVTQLILTGFAMFGTYKLVLYKVDQNGKDNDALRERFDDLEGKHHGHNRELGELKQLVSTTNVLVTQIHSYLFTKEVKRK